MTQHLAHLTHAASILGATADGGEGSLAALYWIVPLWLIVFGGIGTMIGKSRGHGLLGFLFGLTGPWGWFIASFLPKSRRRRTEERQEFANALVAAKSALDGDLPRQPHQGERSDTRECPWCAELIKSAAVVCRFCGRDVEASTREAVAELAPPPAPPTAIGAWAAPPTVTALRPTDAGSAPVQPGETLDLFALSSGVTEVRTGVPRSSDRRWLIGVGTIAIAAIAVAMTLALDRTEPASDSHPTTSAARDTDPGRTTDPTTDPPFDPPPPTTIEPGTPRVDSFTQVIPGSQQNMIFTGTGFGNLPTPINGNITAFRLFDSTQGWNAGAPGDAITIRIAEWTDTTIRIVAFTGRYGEVGRNWTVNPGDDIQIWISNPQTGRGPSKLEVGAVGAQI